MLQKFGTTLGVAVMAIAVGSAAEAAGDLYIVGEKARVERVLAGDAAKVCAPTVASLPDNLSHVRPPVDEIARSLSVDYCDVALVEADSVGTVLAEGAAMSLALEVHDYVETDPFAKAAIVSPAPAPAPVLRSGNDLAFDDAYRALSAGDPAAAASLFATGLETHPGDQAAHYYLGSAYERMGRPDYAAVQYRRVIRNWPGSPEAVAATQALSRSAEDETLLAQAPSTGSETADDGGFFDSIMKVFDTGDSDPAPVAPVVPVVPDAPALPADAPLGAASGTAEIAYGDGARYVGEVLGDRPHGQGRMTYAEGATYEGGFRDGLRHGGGRLALTDGLVYEGGFTGDVIDGAGRIRWPDGATYEGAFVKGARTGDGVYVWPSGARYQGRFENGVIVGPGMFVAQSGERYEGEFQNGRRTGRGVLTLPSGERIEGEFVDGEHVGQ